MFDTLFTCTKSINRYLAAPLSEARQRYLAHCRDNGASRQTLRATAACQFRLVALVDLERAGAVTVSQVEEAADTWSFPGGRQSRRPASREVRQWFIGHSIRWLRFAGRLEEGKPVRHAHMATVAAFAGRMRRERGWSEATVTVCCSKLNMFFDWLQGREASAAMFGLADIDAFVASLKLGGKHGRITINDYLQCLRSFCRFAERQGWCAPGTADGIAPSRFHRDEKVPQGLARADVLRLLATAEGGSADDRRDRAVLLLLVVYGLRAGEIAGLRLDDIDWKQEIIRVRRPKPGRTHVYPLSPEVAEAVLRYLADIRPDRPERSVFLTMQAPVRPVTSKVVSGIVRKRMKPLAIDGKQGPHRLRHTVAQHLLDQGLSMKAISDYLGHGSMASTAIYAKVDVDALRDVAEIDLEGLI